MQTNLGGISYLQRKYIIRQSRISYREAIYHSILAPLPQIWYNISIKARRRRVLYTIYVVFECFSGKREAFVERVKEDGILSAIRAENGCARYDYYFSEKDPDALLLIEMWESKQHQQVHMEQTHMAQLRTIKGDYIQTTTIGEFEII